MELKTAELILREADRAGFLQGGIPESNEDKLEKADRLVSQAGQAKKAGSKNATVMTILALLDQGTDRDIAVEVDALVAAPAVEPQPENGEQMENEGGPALDPPEPVAPAPEPASQPEAQADPGKKKRAPRKKTPEVAPSPAVTPDKGGTELYEGLPVPPDVDAPSDSLPSDFTTLSDVEVRRLHSQYHAYLGRVLWLLSQEEGQRERAQRLYDRALALAIGQTSGTDDRVTVRKIEAQADPGVIEWSDNLAGHADRVRAFKALRDYYEGTCARLSREYSMREAERDTAR